MGQPGLDQLAGTEHADHPQGGRVERAAQLLLGRIPGHGQLNRAVAGPQRGQHGFGPQGHRRAFRPSAVAAAAAPARPSSAPPSTPWCWEAHSWALRDLALSSKLPCAV